MKALKGFITALLVAAPLFANAYTDTWTQNIDFNPNPLIGALNSHTFKHDLTTQGFNPMSDIITAYNLSIRVFDDNRGIDDWLFNFETVAVGHGNLLNTTRTFTGTWTGGGTVNTGYENSSLFGLITLNALGELWVTVSSDFGDFYLDSSSLTARGFANSSSVPEPSSLALLAAGLFGIAAMRRSAARNS